MFFLWSSSETSEGHERIGSKIWQAVFCTTHFGTTDGLKKIATFQTRIDAKAPTNADAYSAHRFNANFAEVRVNNFTGMIKIPAFLL
jgi:hypothetical protein